MTGTARNVVLFAAMAAMFIVVGTLQSWSLSLAILNLCLISAVMALGLNIQWGYAGLLNVGVMGFASLGGLSAVIVSHPPVVDAWRAGGTDLIMAVLLTVATVAVAAIIYRKLRPGPVRAVILGVVIAIGLLAIRHYYGPAVAAVEKTDPARYGFLGGFGLPIILSWAAGAAVAAGVAWVIGKIALGLRSDYLAIATLGISEIIIAILKNEDWIDRGVKNVVGLPRPVPYEIDLQNAPWFTSLAARLDVPVAEFSGIFVKLCYAGLFAMVLLLVLWLAETALRSPWGRMMRAIRDNETAAGAMGKDVTTRHLQVFVLGAAVIGIAGAMLTTLDGQFTPGAYQPLRFTFLIWVMVIVGGSGNNWGAILGGFLIWFSWIEAEPAGAWLVDTLTSGLAADSALRLHLIDGAAHMRLVVMGLILLIMLRFAPRGLIPEKKR